MRKAIGLIVLISFGLTDTSFGCSATGKTYSEAESQSIIYYCYYQNGWSQPLWCPTNNKGCKGVAIESCYEGGSVYGSNSCLPSTASMRT